MYIIGGMQCALPASLGAICIGVHVCGASAGTSTAWSMLWDWVTGQKSMALTSLPQMTKTGPILVRNPL